MKYFEIIDGEIAETGDAGLEMTPQVRLIAYIDREEMDMTVIANDKEQAETMAQSFVNAITLAINQVQLEKIKGIISNIEREDLK